MHMKRKGGIDIGVASNKRDEKGFTSASFRNGIYQGEMAFRQKNGVGAYYWDTGEFYFGRKC